MGFTHFQIQWNSWLGGYRPPDLRSLCLLSSTEFVEPPPPPEKFLGTPLACTIITSVKARCIYIHRCVSIFHHHHYHNHHHHHVAVVSTRSSITHPAIFSMVLAQFVVKVKVPRNRTEGIEEGIGIALLFLDLGARRGLMVSTSPRERLGTYCTGSWLGPRAVLDVCEKSRPHRYSITGPSSP
jgi:hypothetical protein